MAKKTDGCAYGFVTRNMVENISKSLCEFQVEMKAEFKDLKETNTMLYNHLSTRLPPWASTIGIFLGGLLGSTITYILFNLR